MRGGLPLSRLKTASRFHAQRSHHRILRV